MIYLSINPNAKSNQEKFVQSTMEEFKELKQMIYTGDLDAHKAKYQEIISREQVSRKETIGYDRYVLTTA